MIFELLVSVCAMICFHKISWGKFQQFTGQIDCLDEEGICHGTLFVPMKTQY